MATRALIVANIDARRMILNRLDRIRLRLLGRSGRAVLLVLFLENQIPNWTSSLSLLSETDTATPKVEGCGQIRPASGVSCRYWVVSTEGSRARHQATESNQPGARLFLNFVTRSFRWMCPHQEKRYARLDFGTPGMDGECCSATAVNCVVGEIWRQTGHAAWLRGGLGASRLGIKVSSIWSSLLPVRK